MSVVILNVADSIPVTSDATPIIVKILLAAMFQIGLALIANCVSLNLYKKTEMPQWVRVFFLHYLARMLCIDTGHPKADVKSTRREDVKVRMYCSITSPGLHYRWQLNTRSVYGRSKVHLQSQILPVPMQ